MAPPLPTPLQVCSLLHSDMFSATCAEPARQRLLLAGLKLFADQGFAKTSIRQIAVEAGTNVAAISYYFGGKAELYRSVFWGGMTPPPPSSAAPQPFHVDSLDDIFSRMLEPLRIGKAARAWMKLQRREMLEPTGVWQEKIDRGMAPMQAGLLAYLCRRLGLQRPDEEVHALAQIVIGPAVHLLVNCEVIDTLMPDLLDGDVSVQAWLARLQRSAEAVIEAERVRRAAIGPVAKEAAGKSVAKKPVKKTVKKRVARPIVPPLPAAHRSPRS